MPMLKRDVDRLLVEERKKSRSKITTKKEIQELLVAERKKSNITHKESRFKQRTLSIYNGQVRRAKELKLTVSYTLQQFREFVRQQLDYPCPYCVCKLTVNNFTDDHPHAISRGGQFTLHNTAACCKPCNYRKGVLNKEEFEQLMTFIYDKLPPEAITDVCRRLTMGGKWAGKLFN
jgi:5-methylcytosine-specific restriction endonuclease McrA